MTLRSVPTDDAAIDSALWSLALLKRNHMTHEYGIDCETLFAIYNQSRIKAGSKWGLDGLQEAVGFSVFLLPMDVYE